LRRWLISARFAFLGIRHGWGSQRNFRTECVLGVVAVLTALWLRAPLAPVLLACGLVLGLELMNTALEAVVDLVSPELHPLAKVAKDAAAGAVLLACTFAVLVGAVVLLPPLLHALGLR
jgi:diacylglycerol kinase (ATP)